MAQAPDAVVLEVLASYEAELAQRGVTYGRIAVLSLRGRIREEDPVPPGSVIAYVARRGNPVLRTLVAAARRGDMRAIGRIHTDAGRRIAQRLTARSSKPRSLEAIPVFGEIRYRSKTIARAVIPDGPSGVAIRMFPYNGGKLYDADFRLAQFKRDAGADDLEAVLLKRGPQLSPLERRVLARVSGDATENNISAELAFVGAIVNAIVNAGKAVYAATKAAVNWAVDHKAGLLFAAQVVAWAVSIFPRFSAIARQPGVSRAARQVRGGASAHELLKARREALLGELNRRA